MAKPAQEQPIKKRVKISQSEIPNIGLKEALKIATGIWDNFAGSGAAPHNVAMALDLSPTSGGWRNLCGASIAYGLSEGGYNAHQITLTELGRRIVGPIVEGDDLLALQEAALQPKIPGEFFRQYDRAKFPREDIAANILIEKGIPKNRAETLVGLLKENGEYVGFIKETKTGPFVSLDAPDIPMKNNSKTFSEQSENDPIEKEPEDSTCEEVKPTPESPTTSSLPIVENNNRVFITHGKNRDILDQIKEVVELGGFEPIISINQETIAKPIPEKVMDDMRSCGAAVIHVGAEGTITDSNGNDQPQINPNVLIEIGAAMALYKGRFILVVEEGVTLPSNLQGLYESRYSGNSIEFKAGMRILKALRGLKENK